MKKVITATVGTALIGGALLGAGAAPRTCHRSDREHSFPSPRKSAELMKKMTLTAEYREITVRKVDQVHAILRARVVSAEELIR